MARGALVAVIALALLAGCGSDAERASAPAPAAGPEAATGADDPARPNAPADAPRMDDAAFWQLMADTRAAAGNETDGQSDLLEQRLRHLPPKQIAHFERIRQNLDRRAYTYELWGAAYVIEDGCSDDCFRDFRGYLISLGRGPYEAALRDPDSLAAVAQDAETGNWENADDVAPDAYQSVADEDIPTGDSEPSGDPSGTPWDDEQTEQLVRRYPRLAARFR
jgi:Protein of unknown function (DUF4240)